MKKTKLSFALMLSLFVSSCASYEALTKSYRDYTEEENINVVTKKKLAVKIRDIDLDEFKKDGKFDYELGTYPITKFDRKLVITNKKNMDWGSILLSDLLIYGLYVGSDLYSNKGNSPFNSLTYGGITVGLDLLLGFLFSSSSSTREEIYPNQIHEDLTAYTPLFSEDFGSKLNNESHIIGKTDYSGFALRAEPFEPLKDNSILSYSNGILNLNANDSNFYNMKIFTNDSSILETDLSKILTNESDYNKIKKLKTASEMLSRLKKGLGDPVDQHKRVDYLYYYYNDYLSEGDKKYLEALQHDYLSARSILDQQETNAANAFLGGVVGNLVETLSSNNSNSNWSADEYYKKKKEIESKNNDCRAEVEKEYNRCYEGCKSLSENDGWIYSASSRGKCEKSCGDIRSENNRACDKFYK